MPGCGTIRVGHARAVTEAVADPDPDATRQVEAAVLPDLDGTDASMPVMAPFRKKLRREVAKADPRTAEAKAAKAAEGRGGWGSPRP
jgi:hypothetical protein